MSDEPPMIVTRQVAVTEFMDADGDIFLSVDTIGDPAPWDVIGLLTFALEQVKNDQLLDEDCE